MVNSVTFPVDLGGDGSTITDDGNPTTGLADGGHRDRFVPALAQTVIMAATAQAAAAAANAAPGTNGTSTTSLALGTGAKTLTMQTGRSIVPGMQFLVANTADPANQYMHGIATAYDSATGVLDFTSDFAVGTGTVATWTISLTGVLMATKTVNGQSILGTGNIVTTAAWSRKTTTYTAASGDRIKAGTSGGAWSMTMPPNPADGDSLEIMDVDGSFHSGNLSLLVNSANGNATVMGYSTSWVLNTRYLHVLLTYDATNNNWGI